MDPRFRRRWVEVRRQEGRHRLRVLLGLTVAVMLGVGGWATTRSPLLAIERVVVVGVAHTAPSDARSASGLRAGEPLIDVDGPAAAAAVRRLPWVARASVVRVWPHQVTISVVERAAAAVTATTDGQFALVDAVGRVLERTAAPPPGLVVLAGVPPAGEPGSTLAPAATPALAVAVALPPELAARTSAVAPDASGSGEVDLALAPQGSVHLGGVEDLLAKFDAVSAVLHQVDLRNLAVLDVRRPDSPVLTRRDAPTKVSTRTAG